MGSRYGSLAVALLGTSLACSSVTPARSTPARPTRQASIQPTGSPSPESSLPSTSATATATPVARTTSSAPQHVGVAPVRPPALAWAPPQLKNPRVITLCNCNIQGGEIIVALHAGQDYILRDPVVLTHSVVIEGGHNIIWIGGLVRPSSGPAIGIQMGQGAGAGGGTVHLEGIYLDGIRGFLTDGIEGGEWNNMGVPMGTKADATLQIENVRIDGLSGDSSIEHQDCIQQYGGWRELRVDHFTCQTLYQGFTLPWEDSSVGGVLSDWDLRNANLRDAANSTGDGMQTLIHFGDLGPGVFNAVSHQQTGHLENVYLRASQKSLDQETYPNSGTASASRDGTLVHATVRADGTITWSATWAVSGRVTPGSPPAGDYVPFGVAGLSYISPGYQG